MNILSSFLFAISANTDNFAVGLSYGMKKIRIGFVSSFLISLISLAGTIISMSFSKIAFNLSPRIPSNIIGSIILILIGGWTIVDSLICKHSDCILKNPEKADKDNSLNIDAKESVVLALALTLNNVGLGIGAGIAGLNIVQTSFLTFIFSLLMIMGGCYLGSKLFSKVLSQKASLVSGLLMILLGIFEICG